MIIAGMLLIIAWYILTISDSISDKKGKNLIIILLDIFVGHVTPESQIDRSEDRSYRKKMKILQNTGVLLFLIGFALMILISIIVGC
jgi:hypothetical protein